MLDAVKRHPQPKVHSPTPTLALICRCLTDGRGLGPEDPDYTTYYFYDDADRLIRIEGPPVGDPLHRIVQWFGYDEIGNRLWVTDGNGSTPQDPNHTTWYDYDDNNNLVCITDALGGQTQYRYDALNRKIRMFGCDRRSGRRR